MHFSVEILLWLLSTQWGISVYAARCPSNEPVCGTDGITYKNICHLNSAKLEDEDLQVLHQGSCYASLVKQTKLPRKLRFMAMQHTKHRGYGEKRKKRGKKRCKHRFERYKKPHSKLKHSKSCHGF